MNARAIRNLVIFLGILIVIAFAVAVWGIFNLGDKPGNGQVADALADLSLGLPAGCTIADAAAEGARLVMRTDGPEATCARVFVIDLEGGRVSATIRP